MHIFSERLAALMKGRLTQQDIAAAVGVSQPTVQRWLTGTMPGGAELYRLAKYLDVTVEQLLENGATVSSPMALRETPPEYLVDDALDQVNDLKEKLQSLERSIKRIKKGKL